MGKISIWTHIFQMGWKPPTKFVPASTIPFGHPSGWYKPSLKGYERAITLGVAMAAPEKGVEKEEGGEEHFLCLYEYGLW